MKNEKIQFFESNLQLILQSDNGQAVSFRLDTKKLLQLLVSCLFLFIVLLSGTMFFFKERKTNQILVQKNTLNEVALSPILPANMQEETVRKSAAANLQEFTGGCHADTCYANLTLFAPESTQANGSLLIVLETLAPQIGTGNPLGKTRNKYYSYPAQEIKDNAELKEIYALSAKPFHITRSLSSKAEFKIGKFHRPTALHLYLFDETHALYKHETLPIQGEDSHDP